MGAAGFVTGTSARSLVVLAILAGCPPELPPEFTGKVALIRKSAFQGDFGQRLIRVHQGTSGNPQSKLPQKLLRRRMESRAELSFERTKRHSRDRREMTIRDLVLEMRPHVGKRATEAGGRLEVVGMIRWPSDASGADNCAFCIDDG